jgi:serine/threonine protein kinase/DNA-binding winged helix-turn-helix (wHTH) protein/tetratricopeptide (TPR) repeat protein
MRMGSFELDLRSGELRSLEERPGAEKVLLRQQSFVILRMLVERRGKPVTRTEIQQALWPNGTIVEFDRSINVAVRMLRRALGDSAVNPRYIETLGRRGYRLIPSVEWLQTGSVRPGGPPPAVAPDGPPRGLRDLVGTKVEHHRVLEVLGGGGMGMVYKAEDLKLGRHVALKFLPEELAEDRIALLRLEREARTLSALNHPNICTIFDIQNHEGHPFIVMELLEGQTLSQRIAASATYPIPTPEVLDIAIQVCAGLEAAHRKDIVHRDIKPANVFLTAYGPVKVLDFGVAKLIATGASEENEVTEHDATVPSPSGDPTLTATDTAVGTTGYMSPEQVRKEPLDPRSDLFSLGLVLHEMATGRRALTQESPTGDPPVPAPTPRQKARSSGRPRSLDAIISRAMEEDRERRFQTASEMRRELEKVRDRMRRSASGNPRLLIAGVLLLALAVFASWLLLRRSRATVTLAPSDTILVAHPINKTTDRVFDDALFNALRVALEQTPYLNVMQEPKLRSALTPMKLGADGRITPEIALDVCRRTESKLMVAPSISDAGNRLRIGLTATDCRSGKTIAQISPPAVSRDAVIETLGTAATQLRALLGEPPDSVARFNAPLEQATTASPEALELLTIGYRHHLLGKPGEALPYYLRATQADPNFALAHVALSAAYQSEDQPRLAAAASRRAFELRDRVTLPVRFHVESSYYSVVTGEEERSCAVLAEWVKTFPYDLIARNNFSLCLSNLGDLDRALGQAREAARLLPTPWSYWHWMLRCLHVARVAEAREVYDEALRRGYDSPYLRQSRLALALLERDDPTLQSELARAEGKPELERGSLEIRSVIEQHHGRFRAALQLAKLSEASKGKDESEDAGVTLRSLLMQAEAGVPVRLRVAKNPPPAELPNRILEALVLARAGQLAEAHDAAEALRRDLPSHTLVQGYILPIVDAATKLKSNDAAGALEALRPASRYALTNWGPLPNLYSAYLGGLAELRAGDGRAAAAEFQRIFAHPGLVGVSGFDAIARLQLARAQRLAGDLDAARASYEEFLALWKDADDDLPLHREALEEYRKLAGK